MFYHYTSDAVFHIHCLSLLKAITLVYITCMAIQKFVLIIKTFYLCKRYQNIVEMSNPSTKTFAHVCTHEVQAVNADWQKIHEATILIIQ